MNRENAMRDAKLASIRKQSIVNDANLNREYAKSVERGSRKLALAIVCTGKAHGPVNEAELIDYARRAMKDPVKIVPVSARASDRKDAIQQGRKYYDGKPHPACGKTLRFTASGECVWCNGEKQQNRNDRIARAVEQIPAILERHGFTLDEVKSASRLKKYHLCRRDIWMMMSAEGVSSVTMAKMFNRDHTSVLSALSNENAALREIAA